MIPSRRRSLPSRRLSRQRSNPKETHLMHQRMQRLMSCYTKRNAIAALVGAMIGVTWNLARTGLDGAGGYTGILLLIVVGQVIYPVTGDVFYRAWRRVPELIDATPDWVFALAPIFGRTL